MVLSNKGHKKKFQTAWAKRDRKGEGQFPQNGKIPNQLLTDQDFIRGKTGSGT